MVPPAWANLKRRVATRCILSSWPRWDWPPCLWILPVVEIQQKLHWKIFTIAVLTQHFSRWIIWAWDGAEIFWPSKEPPIILEIPLLAWVDGKTSEFIMFGKVHTLTNLFRWDGYLYVPCETLFFIIIFYLDKQPSGFNPTVWLCLVILSHLWAKQPNVIFSEEQRKSYEPVMQPKGVPRLLIETLVCFQHWLPVFLW